MKDKKSEISHRELGWAIREIVDPVLNANDRLILLVSHTCLDKEFRFSWSHNSLSSVTSLSRSSVIRVTLKLIKEGYFTLIKKGSNLNHEANLYEINLRKILSKTAHKLFKASVTQTLGLVSHRQKASVTQTPLASVKEAIAGDAAFPTGGDTPSAVEKTTVPAREFSVEELEQNLKRLFKN